MRRIALVGTDMANATAGSIRHKLLKLGAVVTRSVRRIKIAFATVTPNRDIFVHALSQLRSVAA